MESNKFEGNEKLEFRQIVLEHIKRILEISSHELRDTTRVTTHSNYSETVENEDTRQSYVQSIENLAYVLLPYFDEPIQKKYKKYIGIINAYNFELEDYFKEEIESILNGLEKEKIPEVYFLNKKIEYAKKLFVELNRLLKRVDYLKSAIYGEDKDEVAQDNEEGEE